jgi:23S rRNA U2552 (ribose-2'-O)-methylase RlmE/FtsJ
MMHAMYVPARPVTLSSSDMLHNTTGDKSRDHFLSMELVHEALDFTAPDEVLKPRGAFLAKYLRGSDEQELVSEVKERFRVCKLIKPKASRMESKEMYILGMDKVSTS